MGQLLECSQTLAFGHICERVLLWSPASEEGTGPAPVPKQWLFGSSHV